MAWTWKSYVLPNDELLVKEWYEEVGAFVWQDFKTLLKYLDGQPPANWVRPYTGKLHEDCKGLVELRFDFGNVEYRPIGYYSGKMEFTIVFFATERDGKFDPPTSCEIAQRRRDEIENDKEKARGFWVETRNSKGNKGK